MKPGAGALAALLEDAGRERRVAQAAETVAMSRIEQLVPQAVDAGLAKTTVAELAGICRPKLYEILAAS